MPQFSSYSPSGALQADDLFLIHQDATGLEKTITAQNVAEKVIDLAGGLAPGPPGPAGPQGPTGPEGPQGDPGPAGTGVNPTGNKYGYLMKSSVGDVTSETDTSWSGPYIHNVRDYGATGDGATDDTTAINAAFSAATANAPGGAVYFPTGVYRISDTITISLGAVTVNNPRNLVIYGDGIAATCIEQGTGNKGIFDITLEEREATVSMRDFGVRNVSNTILSTASAFKIVCTEDAANDADPNLKISRVAVLAYSVTGPGPIGYRSFTHGVRMVNIHGAYITEFTYNGASGVGGTGIQCEAISAPYTPGKKPLGLNITNCLCHACEIGVRIAGDPEGIQILQSAFIGLGYGIKTDYCYHLSVIGCHFNINGVNPTAAIYVTGTGAASRIDSLIVKDSLIFPDAANTTGIYGCICDSVISDNVIHGSTPGNAGRVGVHLLAGSYSTSIHNNYFSSAVDAGVGYLAYGIRIASGCSNIKEHGNYFDLVEPAVKRVYDQSSVDADNDISGMAGFKAVAKLTSAESIPTATPTTINWDGTRYNKLSIWSNGNPSRLSVPDGARYCRVHLGISWDPSAAGERTIEIVDNAGNVWAIDDRTPGASGSTAISTYPIDITETGITYFVARVTQTTGGNLDILATQATFFALELV